jgi:hypothetical protein
MESDNLGSYLILLKDTVSEKDPWTLQSEKFLKSVSVNGK